MALKIGIIGFGGMAHWHATNASKIDGVEYVAAFDVDEKALESAEKEFGMKACHSAEELLAIPEINLVLIATPNQFHKPYAIAAMRAGKNVLSEKPATLSVADWDEMVAVSKETGKLLGVHMFDQLLWMYGDKKIVDVKAELMSLLEANREVDDYFKVMMKVEGGPVLTVEVGSYAFRALPRWYCIGDNGTLQIDDFTAEKGGITRPRFGAEGNVAPVVVQTPAGPTRMMAPRPPETREELELPKSDADWTSLYKNLLDVIDNGAELIVKPEQVRRVLQLIETIFESAKTGHSVACRI